MTSDFRYKSYETIDAHVNILIDVLKRKNIINFTYLSSTRVYSSSESTDEDSLYVLIAPMT